MPVLLDGVGSSFVEVTVISLKRGRGKMAMGVAWQPRDLGWKPPSILGFQVVGFPSEVRL